VKKLPARLVDFSQIFSHALKGTFGGKSGKGRQSKPHHTAIFGQKATQMITFEKSNNLEE
jgi:hypothetical protein